jgi:hypothetical protein
MRFLMCILLQLGAANFVVVVAQGVLFNVLAGDRAPQVNFHAFLYKTCVFVTVLQNQSRVAD